MSRYVIIGAGAVGVSLSALLTEAGVPNVLIARPNRAADLRSGRVEFTTTERTTTPRFKVYTVDEPPLFTTDDVLLVTTKVQNADEVGRQWAWRPVADAFDHGPRLVADLPVASLSNGLAAEAALARRFGDVYSVAFGTPARYTEPLKVVIGAGPKVAWAHLGKYPSGLNARAEAIARDLEAARFLVETSHDVIRWKTAKLLLAIQFPLELFAGSAAQRTALGDALVTEARDVLTASGLPVADAAERRIDIGQVGLKADTGTGPGHLSVWQSLVRGSSSEVDYLNGEIVALARAHGRRAPYNEAVQRLAATLFATQESPGKLSLSAVDEEAARLAAADVTDAIASGKGI